MTSSLKSLKVALAITASYGLSACQKNSNIQSLDQSSKLESGISAESLQKTCSEGPSENVSIVGPMGISSGKTSVFSLSSGVNCNDAQLALWKVGDVVVGKGPSISPEFVGEGYYNLKVEIPKASDLKAISSAAGVSSKVTTNSVLSIQQSLTVAASGILVAGTQVGFEGFPYSFSLALPSGVSIKSASWNFGDGSAEVSSLLAVSHSFSMAGKYNAQVSIVKSDGSSEVIQHSISVLPIPEQRMCSLEQLSISTPGEIPVGRSMPYSISLDSCLVGIGTTISWNFGDGTNPLSGTQLNHVYENPGSYIISATVNMYGTSVVITRPVSVLDNLEVIPGPTPAPNVNGCSQLGASRVIDGASSSEKAACGVDGQKTMNYLEKITQTCSLVGEFLEWSKSSVDKQLVSEGSCENQSCSLVTESGIEKLLNGASKSLYTNSSPAGNCSEVNQIRVCNNGVLSGSDSAKYNSCTNGCGDFGNHGTQVLGAVIGTQEITKACQFGETGIKDVVQTLADKVCQNGSIIQSNIRTGSVVTAGSCPVYSWAGTDNYSACSADCGGQQNRIFACKNAQGEVVDSIRCSEVAPVETRICDGNPSAVESSAVATASEEAPASAVCPKNQIGVIINKRTITTTKKLACVDHQIKESTEVQNGAWASESYCRDFTPYRCSNDSLNNDQAAGRYAWIQKCQASNPVLKEFLKAFSSIEYKSSIAVGGKEAARLIQSRNLYATFFDRATGKTWVAPKSVSASCEVMPSTAYIAGVCVSSCATPEQQILVDSADKMKYQTFIESLVSKTKLVRTLSEKSQLNSISTSKTVVDNWVTEIEDVDHEILVFKMKSGGELRLTMNHPLVTKQGTMKAASDFKVGEALVQIGGKADLILSIAKIPYHGKVYNLFVKSNVPQRNIVITNGYLNGTAFFQNEGAQLLNKKLFYQSMTEGAFKK